MRVQPDADRALGAPHARAAIVPVPPGMRDVRVAMALWLEECRCFPAARSRAAALGRGHLLRAPPGRRAPPTLAPVDTLGPPP